MPSLGGFKAIKTNCEKVDNRTQNNPKECNFKASKPFCNCSLQKRDVFSKITIVEPTNEKKGTKQRIRTKSLCRPEPELGRELQMQYVM